MVARTGADQSGVAHERSMAFRFTTIETPPVLEIRRRVPPPGGVRTRDRQIRVLIGRKEAHMLHPDLARALAAARIEDIHRAAARSHTIRVARRVAHEPHVAATPMAILRSAATRLRGRARAVSGFLQSL